MSSDFLLIESEILDEPTVQRGLANLPQHNGTKIYKIGIRQIAEDLGHVRYMGIASLGALAAVDDRVDQHLLEKTIKTDSKLRRFEKQNLAALRKGGKAISLLKS